MKQWFPRWPGCEAGRLGVACHLITVSNSTGTPEASAHERQHSASNSGGLPGIPEQAAQQLLASLAERIPKYLHSRLSEPEGPDLSFMLLLPAHFPICWKRESLMVPSTTRTEQPIVCGKAEGRRSAKLRSSCLRCPNGKRSVIISTRNLDK